MDSISSGYRDWSGQLYPVGLTCWPIARTGVRLVLRRRLFWLLIAFSLLDFLFLFATIYIKAQINVHNPAVGKFVNEVLRSVTGSGETYRDFMFAQGTMTMLVLAFVGEMLVGGDYDRGGLTFYLSRRLGRRHYVVGKLLAISAIVALTTVVPALVLYAEYGFLTDSLTYFRENWRILLGIVGYGTLMAISLSLLLFALASWLNKTVPLVMSWACIFVLLPGLGEMLRKTYGDGRWRLLSFWGDIRLLGNWCFGSTTEREGRLVVWAVATVVAVWIVCAIAIVPRVRAVQVIR
jgi:ABC-type transport system involved in multi-copper enzyme maturation permease subunit